MCCLNTLASHRSDPELLHSISYLSNPKFYIIKKENISLDIGECRTVVNNPLDMSQIKRERDVCGPHYK
jgi:hypothetical protein